MLPQHQAAGHPWLLPAMSRRGGQSLGSFEACTWVAAVTRFKPLALAKFHVWVSQDFVFYAPGGLRRRTRRHLLGGRGELRRGPRHGLGGGRRPGREKLLRVRVDVRGHRRQRAPPREAGVHGGAPVGVSPGPHLNSRAAVTGSSNARLLGNCEKRGPSARVPAETARTVASYPRAAAAAGGRPPF